MYLDGCEGCEVTGGRLTDNENDGVLVGDAPRARIAGNTITGGGDGIDLEGCAGCRVEGNRVEGAGGGDNGIEVEGDVGGARFSGNTTTGGGGSGIAVFEGSTGATFRGNRATGNAEFDLRDDNLPDACASAWRGNQFATDNETGPDAGPGAGCIR